MPSRCAALLALTTAALVALVVTPSAIARATSPATGSAYHWVQPWSIHGAVVPHVGRWAQPPASVVISTSAPTLLTSYPWVQPWETGAGVVPDVGRWTQPPPLPSG